jgi:hypothetical protein
MEDVLLPVDLDRRPVGVHVGDLAAGDAPQEAGARSGDPAGATDDIRTGLKHPTKESGAVPSPVTANLELQQACSLLRTW